MGSSTRSLCFLVTYSLGTLLGNSRALSRFEIQSKDLNLGPTVKEKPRFFLLV